MSAVFPPLDDQGFAPSSPDREIAKLRVPPHSIEAESSVLGGLLLDNNAWDRVGDLLVESHFYRHEHQMIYTAIGALVNASKPADVITVFEHLQNQGKAQDMGGLSYLNNLAQSVPSAANWLSVRSAEPRSTRSRRARRMLPNRSSPARSTSGARGTAGSYR